MLFFFKLNCELTQPNIVTFDNTLSHRYMQTLDLLATWSLHPQRTHGVSPQRVHFITNIDWIMSSKTDWACPITLARLWMKNIHLMFGPVGREGWRAHTLRDWPSWGLVHGAGRENRGGIKKKSTGVGVGKKEKCLLNDIPIVSQSRTMALCKTANNERKRNPLSYRGLAACSPLP